MKQGFPAPRFAVDPGAMVSLLVAVAVAPMANGNAELYVGLLAYGRHHQRHR